MRRAPQQSQRFIEIFWDAKNLTTIHTASQRPEGQPGRAGVPRRLPGAAAADPRQAPGAEDEPDDGARRHRERRSAPCSAPRTQEMTALERGLTFLATTASTAPFIGLFGTVWGIMTAFSRLSSVDQSSSIQAVAPGHRRGADRHRGRAGRGHPGGGRVQSLRPPDPRADGRDGQLRVGIPEHRRASFPASSELAARWLSEAEQSGSRSPTST